MGIHPFEHHELASEVDFDPSTDHQDGLYPSFVTDHEDVVLPSLDLVLHPRMEHRVDLEKNFPALALLSLVFLSSVFLASALLASALLALVFLVDLRKDPLVREEVVVEDASFDDFLV